MKILTTDILVIGAGAAGSMAAIKASDYTKNITVLEKAVHRSGGALGIGHYTSEINPICNVPGGPTSMEFVEEYLSSSSGWSGQERPLDKYIIAEEFTPIVKELESWGLEIYKKPDGTWNNYWHKHIGERMESGCWVKGGTMKKCLMDEVKRRGIQITERTMAVDLLKDNGKVVGAVALNTRTGNLTAYNAKSVILCTGSSSRTYIVNPGKKWFWMRDMGTNSGDGRAMVYRAGGELTMMELIRTDHMQGNVMARFWGGKAVNSKGEDFLKETYRKRWSRSYAMHIEEEHKHNGPLYWDARNLTDEEKARWIEYTGNEKNSPDITLSETYKQKEQSRDKDLYEFESQPIGFLGGPVFNYYGATTLPGLYAAGDEIWQDSLSGAFVFARRAGIAAAKYAQRNDLGSIDTEQLNEIEETIRAPTQRMDGIKPQELEEKIRAIMTKYANLSKTGGMLTQGLKNLQRIKEKWVTQIRAENPHELMRWAEARNIMDVAMIHMESALFRTESVPYGRHFHDRRDYPEKDPAWYRQRVVVKKEKGSLKVFKRETVEQRPPTREEYEAVKEVKP